MPGYEGSTTIDAPIDIVWSVLVDVERMPEWTPSMQSVHLLEGPALRRGSRVRIKQPRLAASIWTVDLFDPPRHFSWHSKGGWVETIGSHLLEDHGRTTLATFSIRHTGLGARAVALLLGPLTRRYVNLELHGLRQRAEQAVSR